MTITLLDIASLSTGLLLARLTLGLLMAAHGSQKLFGWFGGKGIVATAGIFDVIGFRPGRLFATVAAVTEIGSGLLVALGLLGPVGPALVISVMIVAAASMHWKNGIFAAANGIELPLLYGVGALTLLLSGPGDLSLDAALGLESLSAPMLQFGALAAGILSAIGNLLVRRPVAA